MEEYKYKWVSPHFYTQTHTHSTREHEWERRSSLKWERENSCGDHLLCLWVLLLPLVLILSLRKLRCFSFIVSPRINVCVYCLLWLIFVHVILSDKILRSYCLNDKNLTSCWMFQPWSWHVSHRVGVLHMCSYFV